MTSQTPHIAMPLAIIVAGALIAGALYFALGSAAPVQPVAGTTPQPPAVPVRGVQADDHIVGNPDAKMVIVEYSDPECPFCKAQHETLAQVVATYDPADVAWVYRNFPIPGLHKKAQIESEALECAAELGGNDGFWKYANRLYEITPSNDKLDLEELPNIAEFAGLDRDTFTQCLDSGDMASRVQEDVDEVQATGAQGTPHNIILIGDQQIPLSGYVEFRALKPIIDQLLAQ